MEPREETALLPLSAAAKAAWIVDETFRGNAVSLASVPESERDRRAYLRYDAAQPWLRAAAIWLLALSFFETPAWCGRDAVCEAPGELYMSGLPLLSPRMASLLELIPLAGLVAAHVWRAALIRRRRAPSHSAEAQPLLTVVLLVLVLDFLWALIVPAPGFRFAVFFRAFLPLFYWRILMQTAKGIRAIFRPFMDVLVFWAVFVVLAGWLLTLLFHDIHGAERYWKDLPTGILSSFVIGTGADFPMQIMAVYQQYRITGILFILQIVICIFLLFNFILAVVYEKYSDYLEDLVAENTTTRINNLQLAFSILIEDQEEDEEHGLTLHEFKILAAELVKNPSVSIQERELELIFLALDDNGNQTLALDEFMDLLDALELQFDEFSLGSKSYLETRFPALYENETWREIMDFVRSPRFEHIIDGVMVLNVIIILIESSMDLRSTDTPSSILFFGFIEVCFSVVYVAESVLKIAALSWKQYWSDLGNRFDFTVLWILLIGGMYVVLPIGNNDPQVIRYLVCLRCLRLLALLADIPRFRDLVRIFSILMPASLPLLSIFFLSLYFFSGLGVQLFGGLIWEGNPLLDPEKNELVDAYVMNEYMTLNLNDMASAFFMLFCSVVVCYLTEVPAAIVAVSPLGAWAHWYFLIAFAVNTLVISNVVLTLVVDLFVDAKDSMSDADAGYISMMELQERYTSVGARLRVTRKAGSADHVLSRMFRSRVSELLMEREAEAET